MNADGSLERGEVFGSATFGMGVACWMKPVADYGGTNGGRMEKEL